MRASPVEKVNLQWVRYEALLQEIAREGRRPETCTLDGMRLDPSFVGTMRIGTRSAHHSFLDLRDLVSRYSTKFAALEEPIAIDLLSDDPV
jgi:hypothetical protein